MSWKDLLPSPTEIEYINWPEQTSMAAYAGATSEELELLATLSRHASVYQAGTINAPGISDLDFIVVLDDNDHSHHLDKWGELHAYVSPIAQYLVTHGPLIVNPGLWQGLWDFKVLENLRHASGPVLAPPASGGEDAARAHLLVEAEFHIFRPYKRFLKEILQRRVQVRPALSRMLKIKVKTMVLAEFGIERSEWSTFLLEVAQLRSDWFSLGPPEQLQRLHPLMIRCAEIDAEMIFETCRLMDSQGMSLPKHSHPSDGIAGAFDYTTLFLAGYDPLSSLEYAVKTWHRSGELFSLLPANFMLPLLLYTAHAPTVRRYLGERVTVFDESGASPHEPPGVAPILPNRIRLLESYFQFLERQNLDKGLFFRRSEAPQRKADSPRSFWNALDPRTRVLDDVPTLLLRRRLEGVHAQLERVINNDTLQVPLLMLFRYVRKRLAPPGSLQARIIGRPLRAIRGRVHRLRLG